MGKRLGCGRTRLRSGDKELRDWASLKDWWIKVNACNKCQRSAECRQGKRCHLDTSLTDGAGMLVVTLAGAAAIFAVIVEIITQLSK